MQKESMASFVSQRARRASQKIANTEEARQHLSIAHLDMGVSPTATPFGSPTFDSAPSALGSSAQNQPVVRRYTHQFHDGDFGPTVASPHVGVSETPSSPEAQLPTGGHHQKEMVVLPPSAFAGAAVADSDNSGTPLTVQDSTTSAASPLQRDNTGDPAGMNSADSAAVPRLEVEGPSPT